MKQEDLYTSDTSQEQQDSVSLMQLPKNLPPPKPFKRETARIKNKKIAARVVKQMDKLMEQLQRMKVTDIVGQGTDFLTALVGEIKSKL
jgi:hypothetical protein